VAIGGKLGGVPTAQNVLVGLYAAHISKAGIDASGEEARAKQVPRVQVGLLFKNDSPANMQLSNVAKQAGWQGNVCIAQWASERMKIPIGRGSSRLAALVVCVGGDIVATSAWKDMNNAQLSGDRSWSIFTQNANGHSLNCGTLTVEMRLDPDMSEIDDGSIRGEDASGFKEGADGNVSKFARLK
jgi:hypothetical protein